MALLLKIKGRKDSSEKGEGREGGRKGEPILMDSEEGRGRMKTVGERHD